MWSFPYVVFSQIVGKGAKPRALKIILSSSFDFNIYLEKGLVFSPIGTDLVRPIFLEPQCLIAHISSLKLCYGSGFSLLFTSLKCSRNPCIVGGRGKMWSDC